MIGSNGGSTARPVSTIFAPILIRPLNAEFVVAEADSCTGRPRDIAVVMGDARTGGSKIAHTNDVILFVLISSYGNTEKPV